MNRIAVVLEGQFFSGEHLRWSLCWPTPNYAGSFLVTLICFAWVVSGNGWRRATTLGVEVIGYFLLVKTYSRGTLVALGAAAVFCGATQGWAQLRLSWRIWMFRLLLVTACVVGTGLGIRIDPRHLSEDGAITHRLELWRGGLEMIAAAPWRGWEAGESGRAYMNWFEGIDRTEGFTTMVNSYLDLGVARGLPVLGVVMCGLAVLLVLAWQTSRSAIANPDRIERPANRPFGSLAHQSLGFLMPAAGASLVAWEVSNVFTTLWIEPKLWIVPAISCAVIAVGSYWRREYVQWRWVWSIGLASALLSTGGLLVAGELFRVRQNWLPEPLAAGTVVLSARETLPPEAVLRKDDGRDVLLASEIARSDLVVWTDNAVFGENPGKEIRRWIETLSRPRRIDVCDPRLANGEGVAGSAGATWVLAGDQCWRMALAPADADMVLLHPCGRPPDATRKHLIVVLPEFDEEGMNTVWQSWAKKGGVRIAFSAQTGEDIRSAWPAVMNTVCEQLADQRSVP